MSASTAVAPGIASQTGSLGRSTRQAQRPTTYSGVSPATYSPSQQPAVPSSSGNYPSPIPPPPRTSSTRHGASASTSAATPSVSAQVKNSIRNGGASTSAAAPASGGSPRVPERDTSKRREPNDRERRAVSTQAPVSSPSSRNDKPTPVRSESQREPSRRREGQDNGAATGAVTTRQERTEAERERNGAGGSNSRKETRFGEYILGQTLGEGEFGKVKLGWRRDGGVQVAIKLIRRDTLAPHPNRLSKIYREIAILRTLSHPNIVRLHEMVETDRHIGIILEYASGGELFDYILTHRYLKDPPACRLFAQLVSGVGYLHKMGIVHRDLKLENLLLDRNRNIIITDFGFANVFDPTDDITDQEDRLDDPAVIKELERNVRADGGGRRGDLMATSCGSPCYAAPELVVSDGVYTGKKVDVWSCGVILYAMLAGYLPFDDDPANPEGDNINLLYKYIVSTPLTFPEYVTPHARDLLRRILVPNPRKRADLFEVARHSWLSPFANVVGLITSATTTTQDIATTTVASEQNEVPLLARSASVREPSTTTHAPTGGVRHHEHSPESTTTKTSGDQKRNTVQVEYAPPKSQTKRGEATPASASGSSSRQRRPDAPASSTKPAEKSSPDVGASKIKSATTTPSATQPTTRIEIPRTQAVGNDSGKLPSPTQQRATSYSAPSTSSKPVSTSMAPPPLPDVGSMSLKPARTDPQQQQTYSSSTPALAVPQITTRPNTGDTQQSGVSRSQSVQYGSYSRPSVPAVPAVAQTNAQGRLQQPAAQRPYKISNPIPQTFEEISAGQVTAGTGLKPEAQRSHSFQSKSHKRANTVGGSTSEKMFSKLFGGSKDQQQAAQSQQPSPPMAQGRPSMDRPPRTSMSERQSMDQGPSSRFDNAKNKRRFSNLLPQAFSSRAAHGNASPEQQATDPQYEPPPSRRNSQRKLTKHDRRPSRIVVGSSSGPDKRGPAVQVPGYLQPNAYNAGNSESYTNINSSHTTPSSSSVNMQGQQNQYSGNATLPQSQQSDANSKRFSSAMGIQNGSKNRRFGEAYDNNEGIGPSGNAGSNSAARRVMDFFRKRAIGRSKA